MNVDQGLFFRWWKDDYENLDEEIILKRFSKFKIFVFSEFMLVFDELMKVEYIRNLKVWYDYLDIFNYSYVSFMIFVFYDIVVFLIDEEFKERYFDRILVDVQLVVEKLYFYILGQLKVIDVDQLFYIFIRLEDINLLYQLIYFKGIVIYDVFVFLVEMVLLDSLKQDIKEVEILVVFVVFLLKNIRILSVFCGLIFECYLRE